jgi:hypothetical protein
LHKLGVLGFIGNSHRQVVLRDLANHSAAARDSRQREQSAIDGLERYTVDYDRKEESPSPEGD